MQRTVRRTLLIVAAFALFVVPAAAIAAAGFTDVADDSVFVADIEWMKDNGITKGCNPPTNDRYCPSNNVTREQMSAFMHRLASRQVVDAATAIEAENADTLDGYNSNGLVRAYAWDVSSTGDIMATAEVFSATFHAPSAGVLVVNTSLRTADDISLPGAGFGSTYLRVEGTAIAHGSTSYSEGVNTASFYHTVGLSSGVAIPAGSTDITIDMSGGSGVFLYDGGVNAVFTPFGNTANTLGVSESGSLEQP